MVMGHSAVSCLGYALIIPFLSGKRNELLSAPCLKGKCFYKKYEIQALSWNRGSAADIAGRCLPRTRKYKNSRQAVSKRSTRVSAAISVSIAISAAISIAMPGVMPAVSIICITVLCCVRPAA